jgi:A/G-specific adenine glycosylase
LTFQYVPMTKMGLSDFDIRQLCRIRRTVLAWGRANYRAYPWRSETDPWLTLVAELLLQRTRASQVEPVFEAFRAAFPAARDLVRAGPAAAQAVTERLGIHWRGPLLYELACAVAAHGGEPPTAQQALRRIVGIGPYTAAAWLSLHRGKRAVIVDSNVARWLSRLTGRRYPPDARHVKWVNTLADQLTPRRAFRDYNYAVLDFTMTICVPRRPHCVRCPLRAVCVFGRESAESQATG